MPDAIKSETVEPDESEWEVVLETVKDAIKHLCDFRIQEGAMLQKLFEQKIANIATLLKEVETRGNVSRRSRLVSWITCKR
jgi:uncharacterized protein YicC (UPF0701 family)